MATYLPHVKLSFGGVLGTPGLEEWSNTVRFKIGSNADNAGEAGVELDPDQLDTALANVVDPLSAWMRSESAKISAYCGLNWAKLNMIKADGKQRDVNTHRIEITGVAGSQTTYIPHWFTTVALTMRTELQRGRGHSGRIFPPMVAVPPAGGSPYIGGTAANGMSTIWAQTLDLLSEAIQTGLPNDQGATPVVPVVASPASTLIGALSGALLQRITGVVVDQIADVQHRRTRQIPRLESTRATVAGA
jgi:hypothetical protein